MWYDNCSEGIWKSLFKFIRAFTLLRAGRRIIWFVMWVTTIYTSNSNGSSIKNTAPYSQNEQCKIWRRIVSLCTAYTLCWGLKTWRHAVCEKRDVRRYELHGNSQPVCCSNWSQVYRGWTLGQLLGVVFSTMKSYHVFLQVNSEELRVHTDTH